MSKRIRDLIQMAYHTGYLAAKLEHGAVPDSERAEVDDAQRQIIDARNAARDALEADLATLLNVAWQAQGAMLQALDGTLDREYVQNASKTLAAALAKFEQ